MAVQPRKGTLVGWIFRVIGEGGKDLFEEDPWKIETDI